MHALIALLMACAVGCTTEARVVSRLEALEADASAPASPPATSDRSPTQPGLRADPERPPGRTLLVDAGGSAQPASSGQTETARDAGPVVAQPCTVNADCDDLNPCTVDSCAGVLGCSIVSAAQGTACGDSTGVQCSAPDTCDGQGNCSPNHAPDGAPCGDDDASACNAADSCDGAGNCEGNLSPPGAPCGNPFNNACTRADACDEAGTCQRNDLPAGTPCGNQAANVCTDPDSCDGGGICQANHNPGATCGTGQCSNVGTCTCTLAPITAVPFQGQWVTGTGGPGIDTSCDPCGAPDQFLLFRAPVAGTYRIQLTGEANPRIAVLPGCAAFGQERTCLDQAGAGLAEILDLNLGALEQVTLVLTDGCNGDGGGGTISITQL
jgi:hypothetical protein